MLSRRILNQRTNAQPLMPVSSAEKTHQIAMPVHAVQPHPLQSAAWHPARFELPRRSASGGAFAASSWLHRIGRQLVLPFLPFVPVSGFPAPPSRSAAGESRGYGGQSINSTSLGCHYDAQAHAGFVYGLFHVVFLQKGYRKTGMDRTCRFVWKVANYFFQGSICLKRYAPRLFPFASSIREASFILRIRTVAGAVVTLSASATSERVKHCCVP